MSQIDNVFLVRSYQHPEWTCLQLKQRQWAVFAEHCNLFLVDIYVAAGNFLVDANLRDQFSEVRRPNSQVTSLRRGKIEWH